MRRRLLLLALLWLPTLVADEPETRRLEWDPPADDFLAWRVRDLSAPPAKEPKKKGPSYGGLEEGEVRIFAFGRNILPHGRADVIGWPAEGSRTVVRYPFFQPVKDRSPYNNHVHTCPQFALIATLPEKDLSVGDTYTFDFKLAPHYFVIVEMTCRIFEEVDLPGLDGKPAGRGWRITGKGTFRWDGKPSPKGLKRVSRVEDAPFTARTDFVWDPKLKIVRSGELELDVSYRVERSTTTHEYEREDTDNPYGRPKYEKKGPVKEVEQDFKQTSKSHLRFDLVRHDPAVRPVSRLTEEFKSEVDMATGRGLAYLRKLAKGDGLIADPDYDHHHKGQTALALYTMLKCGVFTNDKVLDKPLNVLLQTPAAEYTDTYAFCLATMALEEYQHQNSINDRMRKKGERDANGKKRPRTSRKHVKAIDKKLEEMRDRFVRMFEDKKGRGFGYLKLDNKRYLSRVDNSNTQFVTLALAALERRKIAFPAKLWKGILDSALKTQFGVSNNSAYGGGWTYGEDWSDTPHLNQANKNMTLAALASVAFARNFLTAREKIDASTAERATDALKSGVGYLDGAYTEWQNLGADRYHADYYYLYSLERAGALTGTPLLKGHNWYRENALILFQLQKKGGAWPAEHGELVSTCFALLFLNRATMKYSVSLGS